MTLHPWPQLALRSQHDWWNLDAPHARSSPVLSFLWSFALLGRCLVTGRNHINIHMCSFNDCCRDKFFNSSSRLRASLILPVSHSRKSCANLILILAIVTAAGTRFAFPLHTTSSITSEELRHASVGQCLYVEPEFLMASNSLSGLALLINSAPPSRAASP